MEIFGKYTIRDMPLLSMSSVRQFLLKWIYSKESEKNLNGIINMIITAGKVAQ